MTIPTLPATGGSFLRHDDDTLERIEEAPPARKPTKKPAKKEDK